MIKSKERINKRVIEFVNEYVKGEFNQKLASLILIDMIYSERLWSLLEKDEYVKA